MRNFKRFVAFVLCAVMLVGLVPMAFENAKVTAETVFDGVVQGANDAVVFVAPQTDSNLRGARLAAYYNRLIDNFVTTGAAKDDSLTKHGLDGTTAKNAFENIIMVFADNCPIKTGDKTSKPDNNFEACYNRNAAYSPTSIIYTSKCKVTNENNVFFVDGGADSFTKFDPNSHAEHYTDPTNKIFDYYGKVVFTFNTEGAKYFRIYSHTTFKYMKLAFPGNQTLFYCSGYDLTIDNCEFDITATLAPIVINGTKSSDSSLDADRTDAQTITLNSGTYQYICPRTRTETRDIKNKTINVNLGKIKVTGNGDDITCTAAIADDNLINSAINFTIDGATFEKPFWILGGTDNYIDNEIENTPIAKDSVINIHIKKGTFEKGIATSNYHVGTNKAGTASRRKYSVDGLEINIVIEDITLVENAKIVAESDEDNENIKSSIFYSSKSGITEDDYENVDAAIKCDNHTEFVYELEGENCVYKCSNCDTAVKTAKVESGLPVIYVGINGDDTNDGMSSATPVKNIYHAYDIFANWKKGGYIAITAGKATIETNQTKFGSQDLNNTLLTDCGGKVVFDGNYNNLAGENGTKSTLTSSSGYVRFTSDVEFKNIQLPYVTGHKVWSLNYFDFTAVDNCSMAVQDNYNYTLIAGALFAVNDNTRVDRAKYADGATKIDQTIKIDGFYFQNIMTGTKIASKASNNMNYSVEYSKGCSGTTNIYVGPNSRVDSINMRDQYRDSKNVVGSGYSAPKVTLYIDAAALSAAGGLKTLQNETGSNVKRHYGSDNMFDDEHGLIIYCDTLPEAGQINIVNSDKFTQESVGFRALDDDSAIRITYEEVDNFLSGADEAALVEFGVLIKEYTDAIEFNYVPTANNGVHFANGVAKSICFGNQRNDYYYDEKNPVKFRGVLSFGDCDMTNPKYAEFSVVAVPYAVVKTAAGDGGFVAAPYVVMGSVSESFSYQGIKDLAAQ